MQQTKEIWHHTVKRIDMRGLRKIALATMFITVSLLYLGQLAKWRIILPLTEIQLAATPLTTLIAASIGVAYLWRMRIAHSIEITLLAIVSAHWLQQLAVPVLYEQDIKGIMWTIVAYVLYTIILLITYMVSYLLFTAWHTRYRNKLLVAGVLAALMIASELMRSQ